MVASSRFVPFCGTIPWFKCFSLDEARARVLLSQSFVSYRGCFGFGGPNPLSGRVVPTEPDDHRFFNEFRIRLTGGRGVLFSG